MCSNDPWSYGSRRRQRDKHGVVQRLPKDQSRHPVRAGLQGAGGADLHVLRPVQPHPDRGRRELRRLRRDILVAEGAGGPARRRVASVEKKTVEASTARQGLQGRRSRQHRPAPPDLLRRDFIADWADRGKWVGDFKQIHTAQGPVFLATIKDLFSRRLLDFTLSDRHPTAALAQAAINMAVAVRGGNGAGVIFHTDKGTHYASRAFAEASQRLGLNEPEQTKRTRLTAKRPGRTSSRMPTRQAGGWHGGKVFAACRRKPRP